MSQSNHGGGPGRRQDTSATRRYSISSRTEAPCRPPALLGQPVDRLPQRRGPPDPAEHLAAPLGVPVDRALHRRRLDGQPQHVDRLAGEQRQVGGQQRGERDVCRHQRQPGRGGRDRTAAGRFLAGRMHVDGQVGRHPADHDPGVRVVHRGQHPGQHRLARHGQRRLVRTAHPTRRTAGQHHRRKSPHVRTVSRRRLERDRARPVPRVRTPFASDVRRRWHTLGRWHGP